MIEKIYWSLRKVPATLVIFNKSLIFRQIFEKDINQISNFIKIFQWEPRYTMRADERIDRHT